MSVSSSTISPANKNEQCFHVICEQMLREPNMKNRLYGMGCSCRLCALTYAKSIFFSFSNNNNDKNNENM